MGKKIATLAAFVFMSPLAFALPTIYPQEGMFNFASKIINETDSNIVADTIQGHKFYVMPPNNAYVSVSKNLYLRTANLGFCREMQNLQTYSRNVSERIEKITLAIEENYKDYTSKQNEISEARKIMAEFVSVNNLTEIQSLDVDIDNLTADILQKTEALDKCSVSCEILREQIKEDMQKKRTLQLRKRQLAQTMTSNYLVYQSKKAEIEAIQLDLSDKIKTLDEHQILLENVRSRHLEAYKVLGELEGARATLSFSSQWDQNIIKLKGSNPDFIFEKIPTENAFVMTDFVDLKHVPSSKAIMGYKVSGCVNDINGSCRAPSYPDSMSGTVVLSTIGACPIEHPDYFDLNPLVPNDISNMSFGLTAAYDYPTAMNVNVKATYNMHKMHEVVKKNWSSGGFFKRKKGSSIEERDLFKDSFIVKWVDQDTLLTEEKKAEIEDELRSTIFDRMAKLALPGIPNAKDLIVPMVTSASGALVLFEGLKNNHACRANLICSGASLTTSFLNSVFGGVSQSASSTLFQDANIESEWNSTLVVKKPYMTSFARIN